MINSWDSLNSNLYVVDALIFKWISNDVIEWWKQEDGVDALIFKWISNVDVKTPSHLTSVDALILSGYPTVSSLGVFSPQVLMP